MVERSIPVDEAAEWLGTSARQVRRLIDVGEVSARQVGRMWLVDRQSLSRYRDLRPPRGRPLTPESAWTVLMAATPNSIEEVRSLAIKCRRRAARRPARVLPGLIPDLLERHEVVHGGALALGDDDRGVRPQLYVRDVDVEALQTVTRLDVDGDDPNLLLYAVPHSAWPFSKGERHVSPQVAFVDLIDERDERTVRDRLTRYRREFADGG